MILTVSGPSCAGKDTLIDLLMKREPNLHLSTSVTTRKQGEGEPKTHHHVSGMRFTQMIKDGELAEWEEINGEFYGTPKSELLPGSDVIRNVNYKGALTIKTTFKNVRSVFVLPPSYGVMATRLHNRDREAADKIAARLVTSLEEIRKVSAFDVWFVNDDLDRAIDAFEMVVRCFRAGYTPNPQVFRNSAVLERVQATFPDSPIFV